MDLIVLNTNLDAVSIMDVYESFIWTDRYYEYGDFELFTSMTSTILNYLRQDYYLQNRESEHCMIIEKIRITSDAENGNHITVTGRSLESILERRIVWGQRTIRGNLQNGIKTLLNENIISPSDSNRRISNFIFEASTDPAITKLTINAQYTGDNLYDVINKICSERDIGFKITLNDKKQFVFKLYAGVDRSYDQTVNPYVVFSPNFENIINSDYLESGQTLKNTTLVAGEGEGEARKSVTVGSGSGLQRRELYTDARDIQSEAYRKQLDADVEALSSYEQLLSDDQQSFADETKTADEETAEHNKSITAYNQRKAEYENRIAAVQERISYYKKQITAYEGSLTSDQKAALALRNEYKKQADGYEETINSSSNKISSYNSKLSSERTLTYDKIVQYELGIESEEATKSGYEEKKNTCEQSKTEEEKKLPNYKDTLDNYEKKISKYEEIISEDQRALADETKTAEEETAAYNKSMAVYNQRKAVYESRISNYMQKITEYTVKIAEDQRLLDDLYAALLQQRGKESLSENTYTKAFTSKIEATNNFVYGEDFFNGDVVQIANEYGHETKVRIMEIVMTEDSDGVSVYPTFKTTEGGDEL